MERHALDKFRASSGQVLELGKSSRRSWMACFLAFRTALGLILGALVDIFFQTWGVEVPEMSLAGILEGSKVRVQECFSSLWRLSVSFEDPARAQKSTQDRPVDPQRGPGNIFEAICWAGVVWLVFLS